MAFRFTNTKGEEQVIALDPNSVIQDRFSDTPLPWYDGKYPDKDTISKKYGVPYPRIQEMRRSPEFKEIALNFLQVRNMETNTQELTKVGVLGEKKSGIRYHPDAEKYVIWGKMIEDTDDRVVIQKLPNIYENFVGKSRAELRDEILEKNEEISKLKQALQQE